MAERARPVSPYGERDESPAQQLDRNWGELLQEMRVIQTGIQILFGFLLTVPFEPRFAEMGAGRQRLYLGVVSLVAFATVTNLAPILAHRLLFRRRAKDDLVEVTNRIAVISIVALGLALVGGTTLVVSLVIGWTPTLWVAVGLGLAVMAAMWIGLPLWIDSR